MNEPPLIWNSSLQIVHGSRFDGQTGRCVMGPSNRNLTPEDANAEDMAAKVSPGGTGVKKVLAGGAVSNQASAKVRLEASGIPGVHSK